MLQISNISMMRAMAHFHPDGTPVDPTEHHRRDVFVRLTAQRLQRAQELVHGLVSLVQKKMPAWQVPWRRIEGKC